MNMQKLQKDSHKIAISFGYKINKNTTIDYIKGELEELKTSNPSLIGKIHENISNIKDDKKFHDKYMNLVKGTEAEEIPDSFYALLTYCQEIGLDFETIAMNKKRFNEIIKKFNLK